MRLLRAFGFPLWLARVRLGQRLERVALVGLGIAAGSAMLAAVLGGSLLAQDRSIERAAARVPAADRAVRAFWLGIPAQGDPWRTLDRRTRAALGLISTRPAVGAMLYRQTSIRGALVDLGAVDGLARFVRLRSGRLPASCRPERCEVLQLGGSGPLPSVPGLRLVRVGRATLASTVPFGDLITRETYRSVLSSSLLYHTPATPPFLVANGVAGLARSPALIDLYRSYVWVLPVAPQDVHPWTTATFVSDVTRARSALEASSDLFDVTAPVEELQAAHDQSEVGGRRLLLIGGEAAALLLAFTILAASSMRRDVDAAWRRLTWFGARGWQLVLLTAAEAGAVALAATIVGWAAGAAVTSVVARRAGVSVEETLRHSVVGNGGLLVAVGLAVVATLVLLGTLRARPLQVGGFALSAVDIAALGALVAIGLAFLRGSADASALAASSGTGTFLLLLPGLVAFVAAVAAARILGPVLRLLERWGRRRPFAFRYAALSLARNPGHAAIAVTFLVVSLGLALFAETYRSTLVTGQREQAAYAVPADVVVREDLAKLVPVLDAASAARYRSLGGNMVLRLSGDVSRLGGSQGFALLGLSPRTLRGVGGFRGDFSALSPAAMAARLRPPHPVGLRGVRLPATARALTLPVSVRGDDVAIVASVRTPRGTFVRVPLGETHGAALGALRAPLPADARGGTLVALTFGLTDTGLHAVTNGATGVQPTARGVLTLGRPSGAAVDYRSWIGVGGVNALGSSVSYFVSNEVTARLRPRQPTDGRPVPVIVTPSLAAAAGAGGVLPIRISGQPLVVRVVGTTTRFPSVDGDVVVADRDTVTTAMNAAAPGSAVPDEVWLRSERPAALEQTLRRPPFDALRLESRRAVAAVLRGEPLARGSLLVLVATAAVALVLALVGLLLGLVADLRDESGELFDLESQGAGPPALRRHLRFRTLAVALLGLAGGVVTGAVLSALVVDLIVLTANAAAPQPPLLLALSWPVVLGALVLYVLLAVAIAVAGTARAFRSRSAGRLTEATA